VGYFPIVAAGDARWLAGREGYLTCWQGRLRAPLSRLRVTSYHRRRDGALAASCPCVPLGCLGMRGPGSHVRPRPSGGRQERQWGRGRVMPCLTTTRSRPTLAAAARSELRQLGNQAGKAPAIPKLQQRYLSCASQLREIPYGRFRHAESRRIAAPTRRFQTSCAWLLPASAAQLRPLQQQLAATTIHQMRRVSGYSAPEQLSSQGCGRHVSYMP
jgi:hypothetical protein